MFLISVCFFFQDQQKIEWYHNLQLSQPTQDITAVLDSSMKQCAESHDSSWLSFSKLRVLASW